MSGASIAVEAPAMDIIIELEGEYSNVTRNETHHYD
jgi:hypothetical protein